MNTTTDTKASKVMTPNKIRANRENALESTGPTSAKGKAKSSKNAMAHGLYTAAIVPAIGESPETFAELCAAVRQALRPEGVIEERLADRVALLLMRLDRVTRYEAAVATRAAAAVKLPPDPGTVTGDGVEVWMPAPRPTAPAIDRLAYARAHLRAWRRAREECRDAIAVLDGESNVDPLATVASLAKSEIERLLGWDWEGAEKKWAAAKSSLPAGPSKPGMTFRRLVGYLAKQAKRDQKAMLRDLRERLVIRASSYDVGIAEVEPQEESLVAEMGAARDAAIGAALYADGEAAERVVRQEAHLMRQLSATLDQLDRLRGESPTGAGSGLGVLFRALPAAASRPLPLSAAVGSFRSGGGEEVGAVRVSVAEVSDAELAARRTRTR